MWEHDTYSNTNTYSHENIGTINKYLFLCLWGIDCAFMPTGDRYLLNYFFNRWSIYWEITPWECVHGVGPANMSGNLPDKKSQLDLRPFGVGVLVVGSR